MATTDFDSVSVHNADGLTVGGTIVSQSEHIPVLLPLNTMVVTQMVFIAARAWQVTGFQEAHATLGTDAGAVTIQLEKLTGTTAPGSGIALLTDNANAGLSLKSANDSVQAGTLTATLASLQLAATDRLGIKITGTPTAVAGLCAAIRVKAI